MGQVLRILSANLWNGGAEPEALAELIRTCDADVVCVQELDPVQAEVLSELLSYGRLEPDNHYMGIGTLTRRPAQVTRVPLAFHDAHAIHLEPGDWPGLLKPLEILNLHIAAPHIPPFPAGLRHRRRQLRDLERYLDDERRDARALVGDFNATPLWPAYRQITQHFVDAAVVVADRQNTRPRATWGPRPDSPRMLRIDHGFIQGMAVEDFRVLPVAGSDHSAIVMDLVL